MRGWECFYPWQCFTSWWYFIHQLFPKLYFWKGNTEKIWLCHQYANRKTSNALLNVLSGRAAHPTQYQAWKLHGQLKACDANTNMPFVSNGKTGRERGAVGVTGICGAIVLWANNRRASEALLPLHAPHNAAGLAAACIHLTPALLQDKSRVAPTRYVSAQIPGWASCANAGWQAGDNQKMVNNRAAGRCPAWCGPHSSFWAFLTADRNESLVGHCVQIKTVGVLPYA